MDFFILAASAKIRRSLRLHFFYRFEYPIRYSSIARAQALPSAMAHTTSDCPLCMSPAVKTFGSEAA